MSLSGARAGAPAAEPSPGSASERRLALIAYAGFLLIGWNALLIPTLIRSIEAQFSQSDAGLAVAFFVGALGYGAGSLGGGLLTERLGRRAVLSGAALLLGTTLIVQGLAPSWLLFVLAAVPGGAGAGALDGGMNGLVMAVFRRRPGGALNALHLFFSLGALASPFIVGRLVAGGAAWQAVLLATGTAALAIGLVVAIQRLPSGRYAAPPRVHGSTPPGLATQSWRPGTLPLVGLAVAIATYVAAEIGVSSWLVRFLASSTLETATTALAIFWGGLTIGRLVSIRVADRLPAVGFAAASSLTASVALVAALVVPDTTLSIVLFGIVGFAYAPIYPMIMAVAGSLYPSRIAAVSGTLAAAAVIGSLVYPPLIGLVSDSLGIGAGLAGGAALGGVCAVALVGASLAASARRTPAVA